MLLDLINSFPNTKLMKNINGVSFHNGLDMVINKPQKIISNLDLISPYDYKIFDKNVLKRPYNGKVINAIDYEISRGCIYSCSYCVETIIQKYYGFNEINEKTGSIKNFKQYRRNKSALIIFNEIKELNKNLNISLFRMQDTNFLTIDRKVLEELSELIGESNLKIKLYIETRAEGINEKSISLLKKLKVDGVGMGLELADEKYRNDYLNRFVDQSKIINAFKMLKELELKERLII